MTKNLIKIIMWERRYTDPAHNLSLLSWIQYQTTISLICFAKKLSFFSPIQAVRAYGNNIGLFATLLTKEVVALYYF